MAEEAWSWARRMAQGWVTGGIALGWSGAETISFLREVGLGYRTQDVYEDIRRISGRTYYAEQVSGLLPDSTIPRSWMSEEPSELWHVGVPTKAVGYISYWSEAEKEEVTEYVSIGLPREMTMEEIANYVFEEVPWGPSKNVEALTGWQAVGMMHEMGAGY